MSIADPNRRPDRGSGGGRWAPCSPTWRIGVVIWAHVWFGGHPAGTATCDCGDPAQTIWSLQWVPYALGHGLDPLFSHSLFAPDGINLVDNTSSLLPAFLLSPVTVLFGPVVAFNLAVTVAPALNAWCAFAAIRPFTVRRAPAFVGGLLYGFSPFVLTSSFVGHLQFAVLVLPPLLFLVLYEIVVRRAWSVRRSALTLALLLVAQFFTSTEMLALTVMVAVVGMAVLAVAYRSRVREVARAVLRPLAWGVGLARRGPGRPHLVRGGPAPGTSPACSTPGSPSSACRGDRSWTRGPPPASPAPSGSSPGTRAPRGRRPSTWGWSWWWCWWWGW